MVCIIRRSSHPSLVLYSFIRHQDLATCARRDHLTLCLHEISHPSVASIKLTFTSPFGPSPLRSRYHYAPFIPATRKTRPKNPFSTFMRNMEIEIGEILVQVALLVALPQTHPRGTIFQTLRVMIESSVRGLDIPPFATFPSFFRPHDSRPDRRKGTPGSSEGGGDASRMTTVSIQVLFPLTSSVTRRRHRRSPARPSLLTCWAFICSFIFPCCFLDPVFPARDHQYGTPPVPPRAHRGSGHRRSSHAPPTHPSHRPPYPS